MAYQIKTWKTGSNSILQPLWGIKRGSPTGMEAELRLFHPPSVLPPPLWTIFHSLRPPLPSPCWSKCMSWALSPWAPPGQTRETNTHPHPWRERHPAHLTSGVARAQYAWSEVLVAQSCPTLWDPMDYSPPGSSVHGILQGIFPTQGLNPGLLHCRRIPTVWATRWRKKRRILWFHWIITGRSYQLHSPK